MSSDESVDENAGEFIDDGGIEVDGVSESVKDDKVVKFEGIIKDEDIFNDWGIVVEGGSNGKGVVNNLDVSSNVSVCLTGPGVVEYRKLKDSEDEGDTGKDDVSKDTVEVTTSKVVPEDS